MKGRVIRVDFSAASEVLSRAREYDARGWQPLPLHPRSKRPSVGDGWQDWRCTGDELDRHFRRHQNVGVLLGDSSGGLTDIDLDHDIARALAASFLPETGARFGRASTPSAHWLYVARGAATEKFTNPLAGKGDKAHFVEIRSTGAQTVFPGSVHKDTGEAIEWADRGHPSAVEPQALRTEVARLAAASLLVLVWNQGNSRDDIAACVVGILRRSGWAEDAIKSFIGPVARAAGDDELEERRRKSRASLRREYGWPTLRKALADALGKDKGNAVVDRLSEWLALKSKEPERLDLSGLKLRTSVDIAGARIEKVKPLFEGTGPDDRPFGLLHPGAHLFTSRAKGGKSWVVLRLSDSVSHGRSWLNYPSTGAASALYIAAEDDDARLKERQELLKIEPTENLKFINRTELAALAKQYAPRVTLCEFLAQYLDANRDVRLVIIDTETVCRQTWGTYRPIETGPRRSERATEVDYRQVREFDEIAQPRKVTIILTNHAGKRKNGEWQDIHELINRTGTAMAGATGGLAMSDPPGVNPLDGPTRQRVLGLRGRDMRDDIMLMIEQEASGDFKVLGRYHDIRQTEIEDELLRAALELQNEGGDGPITSSAISEHVEKRHGAVKRALSRMKAKGRTEWGAYRVEVAAGRGGGVRLTRVTKARKTR